MYVPSSFTSGATIKSKRFKKNGMERIPLAIFPRIVCLMVLPINKRLLETPMNEANLKKGLMSLVSLTNRLEHMSLESGVLELEAIDDFFQLLFKKYFLLDLDPDPGGIMNADPDS